MTPRTLKLILITLTLIATLWVMNYVFEHQEVTRYGENVCEQTTGSKDCR